MRFIQNNQTDPFFNLALEEYLLKEVPFESFVLWRSQPSIVVGKHQNALSEVNYPYVYENDIIVARRLSGGGTVFHGQGNINFTFIRDGEPGKLIDFRKHTEPVIEFLKDIGVPARFEGKNDLRVHGLKISGNAEHVFKNRVLHHGTLLYDANLKSLNEAIRIVPGRYTDKSVQSVRSKVANICDFLSDPPDIDVFMGMLASRLKGFFEDITLNNNAGDEVSDYHLSDYETEAVRQLAHHKYSQWDWIYGYSPNYIFTGTVTLGNQDLELTLDVKKGVIRDAQIISGKPDAGWTSLAKALPGRQHRDRDILNLLQQHEKVDQGRTKIPSALIPLFF
jgi:lipoate---protein ligase